MSHNPLMAYQPHPRVFIQLPSQGLYYHNGEIDKTDSEIGVRAMSAKDEMMLSNPDALMNGRAVSTVIANCVPQILKPLDLVVADIEALLLAIKLASGTETYEVGATCPQCKSKGVFERDIEYLVHQSMSVHSEIVKIPLDSGLIVHLRPNSWDSHTKIQNIAFQQHKLSSIALTDEYSDDEKKEFFSQIVQDMMELNMQLMVDCILGIETPEGIIDNPEFIREYIETLSKATLQQITQEVEKLNDIGVEHEMEVECSNEECGHQWTIHNLRYDPSHFFVRSSSTANPKK